MRQLYSLNSQDNGRPVFWSQSQEAWVSSPTERDIYTGAWISSVPLKAAPDGITRVVELRANPVNYVHIYDRVGGEEVKTLRKHPYVYLQWGDDQGGEYKAYQSEAALKAAVLHRWNQAEDLGSSVMPVAYAFKAFCLDQLTDYPDYHLERGPRGGARKVKE